MEYKFKPLTSQDIFPIAKLISKIGLKNAMKSIDTTSIFSLFENKDNENMVSVLGFPLFMSIADLILSNLDKCEDDIYKILSASTGLTVAELKQISIADFAEMIIGYVKQDGFADFIKVVSKFIK
ncbi:MAG: hypothetical protein LBS74_02870 [Oscillospiraceae bacterium]|jgi:hypothetical protein|nr:hypothetical protein [Oscillospiraceae bacterium]